jgi:hypothetical protein
MPGMIAKVFGTALALILAPASLVAEETGQPAPQPSLAAQETTPTQNSCPRVFISNLGSDDEDFVNGNSNTGGPNQAYYKFYAAVKSSGRYQLVGSPEGADCVFAIRYSNPSEDTREWVDKPDPFHPLKRPEKEAITVTVYHPKIRLTILDATTLAVRGTFTQAIQTARIQEERNARFADAIEALVVDAGALLGLPPASPYVPSFAAGAPFRRAAKLSLALSRRK